MIAFRSFWKWCYRQVDPRFQRDYPKRNEWRWSIFVRFSLPLMTPGKRQKLSGYEFTRYSYKSSKGNIPDIPGYGQVPCVPLANCCVSIATQHLPYQQKLWQS